MYTIWHDCGESGRTYYTEYSEIDIKKEGGIEAIERRNGQPSPVMSAVHNGVPL